MSPADARVLVLAAELERDFLEVQRRTSRSAQVDPAASEPEAAFVALEIDHAYQAFESLVVRLETSLGLARRDAAEWHRRLLEDAARPVAGLRPVVVPVEALDDWMTVLSFRHFLRHAYSADLDPRRLVDVRHALVSATERTAPAIATLVAALRATG